MAPLLVKVSHEMLNLEAKMFFDCDTYIKNLNSAKDCAEKLGYDPKKIMKVA